MVVELEWAVRVRVAVANVVAVAVAVEWCLENAVAVAVDMAVEVVGPKHLIPFWNIIPTYVGSQ